MVPSARVCQHLRRHHPCGSELHGHTAQAIPLLPRSLPASRDPLPPLYVIPIRMPSLDKVVFVLVQDVPIPRTRVHGDGTVLALYWCAAAQFHNHVLSTPPPILHPTLLIVVGQSLFSNIFASRHGYAQRSCMDTLCRTISRSD